jgi:hypothetical protein
LIEAVEECVEGGWAQSFSHSCRAAEIGKQQRDRYLYPGHVTFAKLGDAFGAERWIEGLLVPCLLENEATKPAERSCAQLAAWIGWDSSECPPLLG